MNHKTQKVIFIYGPTAGGKTAFADQLAKLLKIEIINMDMGQMYAPLSIGTAKPDWKESTVPQHLFDIINCPENYSVARYRDNVIELVRQIIARGNIPVLVGGSGFYLKSLLFALQNPTGTPQVNQCGHSYSWEMLHEIDPDRARSIHPNDHYRINRALDIWYQTGTRPSLYKPIFDPIANGLIVYCGREREELKKRIRLRTELMKKGWVQEVQNLIGTDWDRYLMHKKKIIGYDVLLDALTKNHAWLNDDPVVSPDLWELIIYQTEQYAKRQETFWRHLQKELNATKSTEHTITTLECNLTFHAHDLYLNNIFDWFCS